MIVKQAANVLDLLEMFAKRKRPATLTEVSDEMAWPRSSTFNLLGTLVERGFLYEPKARGGYYPTPRWLSLAQDISEAEPLPSYIHDLVKELAAATGESVGVGAQAGTHCVFLDAVESEKAIRYAARIGKRIPIHATANGRAILSQLSKAERTSVLKRCEYIAYHPSTPTSPEAVEAEISASAKRGWFQSLTEFTPDVVGVAVALPVGDRRLSLFVAAPAARLREKIPATAAIMQEMVARYLRRGE